MNAHCAICSEFFDDTNPICAVKCGHTFHTNCVRNWIIRSTSCPFCRNRISLNDITQIYLDFQMQHEVSTLKSQLLSKEAELIACKRGKDDALGVVGELEKRNGELQQTVSELESDISALNFRLESVTALESKVTELERVNRALSYDLEYLNKVHSIVGGTLKDAEHKINFYEEAMALATSSNDKTDKHSKTDTSAEISTQSPGTSRVTAKRSASVVNLPDKKLCLRQTPSAASNKSTDGLSTSLPSEDANEKEVVLIHETLVLEERTPRRSPRIKSRRDEAQK